MGDQKTIKEIIDEVDTDHVSTFLKLGNCQYIKFYDAHRTG